MKHKSKIIETISFVVFSVILWSCAGNRGDWNQFRGPECNVVVANAQLPESWNDSLNVQWTFPLTGAGWSSPIVVGDKIFITSSFQEKKAPEKEVSPPSQPARSETPREARSQGSNTSPQGPPPPPPADDSSYMKEVWRWEVTCIHLNTGKEVWKKTVRTGAPFFKKHAANNYACETPVTDGKRIYAYFGMNGLFCLDLNGTILWEKYPEVYKTLNGWGTGSSPVLYNNMLFIQADNEENSYLMALDAATGIEKWKVARSEKTTYSTPVIWKNEQRTELVTTGKTARSYEPETGKLLWELNMGGEMAVLSPVYDKNRVYVGIAGGRETKGVFCAVKAGATGDITPADSGLVSAGVAWTIRGTQISNPSPLLYNGLIYLMSGRGGELCCIDASTGEEIYRQKLEKVGSCWATPWINNEKIYLYDEKGVTQVLQSGKEFSVLSQNTLKDKFWTSVAVTEKAYIFKGVEKIFCVQKK